MTTKLTSLLTLATLMIYSALGNDRPNIVWISTEDIGPHLGCYGDSYATTPNIDAFAKRSLTYLKASSNAPVCAVARTTLISGMYAHATGAQHMRSRIPAPSWMKLFPAYLQAAGYYTANSWKEDYNLTEVSKGWDDSSKTAHWKNHPEGKPFFAVFNYTGTHESRIRNENENPHHDPAKAPVPPYHPDTPEVRKDWAQYYDRISQVDEFFAERMKELEDAGLLEDTVVFFWGDHGSGMPRHKRYPGWSGVNVPLIVHVPEKYKSLAPWEYEAGKQSNRLVSFVDFAPTMLSLAGVELPDYYHGEAFMGGSQTKDPKYMYGFRGRMDERPDFCRTVTDGRFFYIRNFNTHIPHGQFVWYQQETPTTSIWYQLYNDGKLSGAQTAFWEPHPAEEMYDLLSDPHETVNLALDPDYGKKLRKLRNAVDSKMIETRDLGIWPEPMLREIALAGKSPLEELAPIFENHPKGIYPTKEFLAAPVWASEGWKDAFERSHPVKRYWTLMHLRETGGDVYEDAEELAVKALEDEEPVVAVAAAECIGFHTTSRKTRRQAVEKLIEYAKYPENELMLCVHALNALDHLRERGVRLPKTAAKLTAEHDSIPGYASTYLLRIIELF